MHHHANYAGEGSVCHFGQNALYRNFNSVDSFRYWVGDRKLKSACRFAECDRGVMGVYAVAVTFDSLASPEAVSAAGHAPMSAVWL